MKLHSTKARGFRRQYVQLLWGYYGPQREAGWSNETEEPYRYGHCSVRRLGRLPVALVYGRWQGKHESPARLHAAWVAVRNHPDADLGYVAHALCEPTLTEL